MRIVKVVLVLVVLAVAWKTLGPKVESLLSRGAGAGGEAGDTSEAGACLAAARQAVQIFGDGVRRLEPSDFEHPPFLPDLRTALDAGRDACDCSLPGCSQSREALGIVERAAEPFHDPGQIPNAIPAVPRRLEDADSLLVRARAAMITGH